ncbi:AAA family ATPase [Glycomyces algeriensis]|uniref:Transcriptional regulator NadR n=1 Tax=Glycomyces algeriensis TaxID=256037 RepID=A0A9W6LI20_9ACTN|nr:AAA family ATPase [Glycomyces algeriensis]MDA1364688.1 AAA family ATPase [Glycomyces algeriensis]MDR7350728.1 NadR type nicotinamide-nucleotide adenylyltransferase [Glycomyces algeriensis]GLI43439.1 transcriptional regulator NadR [Glycomyces algeriensis]
MTKPDHGLVLGKFYPPHAGHHHLIRTARAGCERLTVLVSHATVENIPLATRMAWLQEAHPDARVIGTVDDVHMDLHDEAIWQAHVDIFKAAVPERIDALFTSESYGPELARRLGAAHVEVDQDRGAFPISGTKVRADPAGSWDYLEGPVRAGLALRVVALGAESTGTTTIAEALADHYRGRGGVWSLTQCAGEYGRTFSEERLLALQAERPDATWADVRFATEDFPVIAERQLELEERAVRIGGPVLFCDTDAFATGIWHERYMGGRNPAIDEVADRVAHDLYLLTDHEGVPFEDDGLRSDEHLRPWMTARFAAELERTGRRYVTLRGPHEQRLKHAVEAVDALIEGGWRFTQPLPEYR